MSSGCVNIRWAMAGCAAAGLSVTGPAIGGGFPADNVSLYSHLTLQDLSASGAFDCWGYVSESGREYAIIGLSNGTAFVEITDPVNPVITGPVLTPNAGQDMKVYQNYVYVTSDSGPSHVIDVADIDSGVISLVNTIAAGAHNLALNEESGFLYACLGGPMVVFDLADPANPIQVGLWAGQTHDAYVVNYTEGIYAGREIAFVFAGSSQAVNIVDVTDKGNMFLLGSVTYPNAAYCHQGWLADERRFLYANDELDGIQRTSIFDVEDLSNPVFYNEFTSGLSSTDHNLYVRDGFIFEASYTGGLRIFDGCDPINPVEVGFFDTFPGNNSPGFSGVWSNFPFFPSGTVIVSDRSGGLFVLDPSQAIGQGCCPADLDGSGDVGVTDLLNLLGAWGTDPGGPPDFDDDGDVGVTDLLLLLGQWGPCHPEPPDCVLDAACDDGDPCTLDTCDNGVCVNTVLTPCCGNDVTEQGEECDGPDDAACPGLCSPACTCYEPLVCCDAQDSAGCGFPPCEILVCAQLPFCCNFVWSQQCADVAAVVCGICP